MCIQGWGSQALREAENAPEEDHSDCLVVFYRFYPINFHWPWRDHYGREVPYGTGRKAPEAPTSSPGIASRKGPISYNKMVGAIFWWWSCRNWTSQVTELRLIQLIRPSSYCRYFQIYGLLREKKKLSKPIRKRLWKVREPKQLGFYLTGTNKLVSCWQRCVTCEGFYFA